MHVLEAGDHVGGRLATERIDGFVVDRGFQVLNTGYPRAADLDLAALELGWFARGAIVRHEGRPHRVVDPRRQPGAALDTLTAPLGLAPREGGAGGVLRARRDTAPSPAAAAHRNAPPRRRCGDAGVGDDALERFLRPFLAGVLLEDELATSSRYLDLLWRSLRPRPRSACPQPDAGRGERLAAQVDGDRIHLRTRGAGRVPRLGESPTPGAWRADAVVVATDPGTAAALLPGVEAAAPRQVTTHFHVLPSSPWAEPLIVLGEPGGRLVNSVVVSDAQPAYSPDGRALVASSTLGPTREADVRDEIARAHDVSPSDLEHLTTVTVTGAQPAALPPLQLRRPVDLGDGVYVCGDHRDTPSIQGAMASGARTARAVLRALRPSVRPTGAA